MSGFLYQNTLALLWLWKCILANGIAQNNQVHMHIKAVEIHITVPSFGAVSYIYIVSGIKKIYNVLSMRN